MTPDAAGQPKPAATNPATPPTPRPGFRIEKDPLGYLEVPDSAYYGVQTARGIHNFPISGTRPHPALVRAIVQVKKAAARANMTTGRLPKQLGNAIVEAADEILLPAEAPAEEADDLEPVRPSDPMKAAFAAARAAKQARADRQLPHRPVPGRRRNQPQHERQRGAGQPGHRAAPR